MCQFDTDDETIMYYLIGSYVYSFYDGPPLDINDGVSFYYVLGWHIKESYPSLFDNMLLASYIEDS